MRTALALAVLLLLAGCQARTLAGGTQPESVWVAQEISAGQQCQTTQSDIPDTASDLAAAGIDVLEVVVEPMAVCQACGICPAYAARHFARIPARHLGRAEKNGYTRSTSPDSP